MAEPPLHGGTNIWNVTTEAGGPLGIQSHLHRPLLFSIFNLFSKTTAPECNLKQIYAFSKDGPKTKVAQNLILRNFVLGCSLKFQMDFEIHAQNAMALILNNKFQI
jgi:hypothetical protein